MLVVELSDQLGNQMFAYASVKSIALDLNFDFKFFQNKNSGLCNDTDELFGHDVESIFINLRTEFINNLPQSLDFYRENTTIKCKSAFKQEVYCLPDNTLLAGHYICPKYFEHRIEEVREWFRFPKVVDLISSKNINEIRANNENSKLVSVHFRNHDDYRSGGFMLNANYWFNAAKKMQNILPHNLIFVVFYDTKTKLVNDFIDEFSAIELHNSLIVDMCSISKCDSHIVCNSSFSIMSAILNEKDSIVIRPSKYIIPDGSLPDDVFPSGWEIVYSRRDELLELKRKVRIIKSDLKRSLKSLFQKV